MSVTVYQIPFLGNEDENSPVMHIWRTLICNGGSPKWDETFWKYFRPVASVYTDDLEDCFRLMNRWDEPERVEQFNELTEVNARSLSVGDIVKKDSRFFMVDSIGFSEISVPD